MALITSDPRPRATPTSPMGPEQGVIEEARRRQRQRYTRTAIGGLIGAALIGAIVWALSGGASHASTGQVGEGGHTHAVDASDPRAPVFNVRVVPMLTVGQAGWCIVTEERGVTGGSACGGVPTPSKPFLQVYGWGVVGSHYQTAVAVTDPQVAAILVNGKRRVATIPLPGLPYGLRGARIVTPVEAPRSPSPTFVALNIQGHPMPQRWTNTPRQATVRSWRYPSQPPPGLCQLQVSGVPGLSARAGQVATTVRAFPGQLVGHAFLPCISTTYYLNGLPVRAMIALDAANPRGRPAALPDFKPVPRSPGLFSEGGLAARRSGNTWLIVAQGTGLAERTRILRHLTASVQ